MMTMMPATDAITSIPLHQSTLRVLQRVKSAAETWDEFLINVTDDYLSPSLRAELDGIVGLAGASFHPASRCPPPSQRH